MRDSWERPHLFFDPGYLFLSHPKMADDADNLGFLFGVHVEEKPKKKKKPKLPWPYVSSVHNCAMLTVDPGKTSGWCLWNRGAIIDFGHIEIFADSGSIELVLDRLLALEGPHALVVERPFGMKFGTATSGTGAGDVAWRETAKRKGVKRHVRVFPNTWRSKSLPAGWAGIAKRGEIREEETRVAHKLLRLHYTQPVLELHPDAAPAICIGPWAAWSAELYAKLPKRGRVPSLFGVI